MSQIFQHRLCDEGRENYSWNSGEEVGESAVYLSGDSECSGLSGRLETQCRDVILDILSIPLSTGEDQMQFIMLPTCTEVASQYVAIEQEWDNTIKFVLYLILVTY